MSSMKRRRRRRESCKTKKARYILDRSFETVLSVDRLNLFTPKSANRVAFELPAFCIGDCIDIFSFLFSKSRDYLITNDNRKVGAEELRGKNIVIYTVSLTLHQSGGLLLDTFHMKEAYDNDDANGRCFEVVFVGVDRGDAMSQSVAEDRFNTCFADMPWPAVPFSDKLASDRLEHAFYNRNYYSNRHSFWNIVDPVGNVVFWKDDPKHPLFALYGGLEFSEFLQHRPHPKSHAPSIPKEAIDLNHLLSSPCRDFLLASDNTKVPVSSLQDKVVGLYFCPPLPDPTRMEAIKNVYQQVVDLGHEFEIVQINYHYSTYSVNNIYSMPGLYVNRDLPVCRNNYVPWLTLPFKDPCFRRLVRTLRCFTHGYGRDQESLVIINPHEPNVDGSFLDFHGADNIQHFGAGAYPFTRHGVVGLELARIREQVKLGLFFGPCAPPLLRGGCCDQVPVSHLLGRNVLLLFATHSQCQSCNFVTFLKSKYSPDKFEVVYISDDHDQSTFEECTREMPWLVHPYSWEFAKMCRDNIFILGMRRVYQIAFASFHDNGELLSMDDDECLDLLPMDVDNLFTFSRKEDKIEEDFALKYELYHYHFS